MASLVPEWKTVVLGNARAVAEHTGRLFAVSCNIANSNVDNSVLDDLKSDWMDLVNNKGITKSVCYLYHNGLPVLRIYGIGFKTVCLKLLACLIDADFIYSSVLFCLHLGEYIRHS